MTTTRETNVSRERTRAPTHAQPGAITSAMRTVRHEGRRIARIARVEQGRIVDEWLSGRDTKFAGGRLLRKNDGHVLELDPGARARVANDEGVQLVTGPCTVPLSDDARGKVMFGELAHLFQLVVEAPKVKPQLPVSAIARGEGVDWRFAIVVAISLLGHFGFASAASADWFDPTVDDDKEAVALITEARSRPELAVEEPKPSEAPSDDKPAPTKVAAAAEPSQPGPAKATGSAKSNDLGALSNKLDDLGLSTIASLGNSGPAKSKLLNEPSAADGALDELAKKSGGVEADGPKLKGDPGGGDPLKPSGNGIAFGDTKGNTPKVDNKPPAEEPKIPVKANEPVVQSSALPSDVNSVIAKNRWKLKACYTKELAKNPDAQGTVYATVTISMEGDVLGADATSSMSSAMNQCVAGSFLSMHFAPTDGKATFKVPVIYTRPGS